MKKKRSAQDTVHCGRWGELASDDLHTVLQVDPRDEEAEGIAWEARHIL